MDVVKCIVMLLGGLAIFLYSMKIMSSGLEAAAGNKLQGILEKLTANRFLGIALGVIVAALVQSSSTTTVMVVGFVNAGLLNLTQALWIIMGANIGTNITSQLNAFKFGEIAPVIAIVGVLILLFGKKKKYKPLGDFITGLGFIFISTNLMSSAMEPVRDNAAFKHFLSTLENPNGIVSSDRVDASIASEMQRDAVIAVILALIAIFGYIAIRFKNWTWGIGGITSLASTGVIGLNEAIFILYGMHVGTCITAVLSAIGTNRSAVKAALMHLTFNVFGVIFWTILTLALPITDWVSRTTSNPQGQIANAHLLFALGTAIVLIPFGKFIVMFVNKILPEKVDDSEDEKKLVYLSPAMLRTNMASPVIIAAIRNEVSRMVDLVCVNVGKSFDAVLDNSD